MKKAVKLLGPVRIGAAFHKEGETVEVDNDVLGELEGLGLVSIEAGADAEPVLVETETGNAIHENIRAELELQLKKAKAWADGLAVDLAAEKEKVKDLTSQRDARIDELTQEVANLKAQIAASAAPTPAPKAKTTKS